MGGVSEGTAPMLRPDSAGVGALVFQPDLLNQQLLAHAIVQFAAVSEPLERKLPSGGTRRLHVQAKLLPHSNMDIRGRLQDDRWGL